MSLPRHARSGFILILAILHCAAQADDGPLLKNWFNDPFFQASDGMRNCPPPRGPLLTEAEMKGEAHSRVERGTSCWMAGTCKEPNAYLYDASIAQAIRERMPKQEGDSLWITVRRRWVWVEGCVSDMRHAAVWEEALKAVPDVERVLVNVMQGASGKPPYPTLP